MILLRILACRAGLIFYLCIPPKSLYPEILVISIRFWYITIKKASAAFYHGRGFWFKEDFKFRKKKNYVLSESLCA